MDVLQRAKDRGTSETDWLQSRHSFSFNQFYDETRMGAGPLRVLNEDVIAPRSGFPPHSHRDMEILTYVLEGELSHRDSAGHAGVIRAGEVQFMRAGRGITHSEMNGSTAPVRLLQIWLSPLHQGLAPTYGQTVVDVGPEWTPLAGPTPNMFALDVDATLLAAKPPKGRRLEYAVGDRQAYLFVIGGHLVAGGHTLGSGDALLTDSPLSILAREACHVLLFDLSKS